MPSPVRPPTLPELPARDELERGLTASLALRPGEATVVDRRRVDQGTVPKEVVTIRSATGVYRLFCKHGGAGSKESHPYRRGTRYEADVYRTVVEPSRLSAPVFVEAFTRRDGGTTLVLEHIEGAVKVSKANGAMPDAAGWLGCFHAQTENVRPQLTDLTLYDAAYFRTWARRTAAFAAGLGRDLPWLEPLCARVVQEADELFPREACVVHGEFTVDNVLVRGGEVLPTDWETAAVGPGEIDLAMLTDGWPDETLRACENAYASRRWRGQPPPDFRRRVATAQIYVGLRWLGNRPSWAVDESKRWRYGELRRAAAEAGLL